MVELRDYNIYTTDFSELPCLEDAIRKGYKQDDESNKTNYTSIRKYPIATFPVLTLVQRNFPHYSISELERRAIIYGMSILTNSNDFNEILELNTKIYENVLSDEDLFINLNGMDWIYATKTVADKANIGVVQWCKDLAISKRHVLGMSEGRFIMGALYLGLSKSEISNQFLLDQIIKEKEWFDILLRKKRTYLMNLIS